MIIHIEISLGRDDFPTPEELETRNTLEDLLEESQVGAVVGVGSGMGIMDIDVEVDDTSSMLQTKMDVGMEVANASWELQTINDLIKQCQIQEITTITIMKDT